MTGQTSFNMIHYLRLKLTTQSKIIYIRIYILVKEFYNL
jgi:hypothetical protein